jgi:hypothetical protein
MWLIKWVELDDVLNHHPIVKIVETYNEARDLQYEVNERFDSQLDDPDNLESGKVVSEPLIEEITFKENLNTKQFHGNELITCNKCNIQLDRIIVKTALEAELVWNEKVSEYEIAEEHYNLEESNSVICHHCMSNVLKQ